MLNQHRIVNTWARAYDIHAWGFHETEYTMDIGDDVGYVEWLLNYTKQSIKKGVVCRVCSSCMILRRDETIERLRELFKDIDFITTAISTGSIEWRDIDIAVRPSRAVASSV